MISFFESMNIDSLASTHPIILDVQTKDEIRKLYRSSSITYDKASF